MLGDRLAVELLSGETLTSERQPGSHVSRFLVTLPAGKRTLLITRDMLGREEFRRLRLWALWGRLPRRTVAAAQL